MKTSITIALDADAHEMLTRMTTVRRKGKLIGNLIRRRYKEFQKQFKNAQSATDKASGLFILGDTQHE